MKLRSLRTSIALALFSVAVSVSAKPLVVCTEASPEGFDIVQYTTAVTADAAWVGATDAPVLNIRPAKA